MSQILCSPQEVVGIQNPTQMLSFQAFCYKKFSENKNLVQQETLSEKESYTIFFFARTTEPVITDEMLQKKFTLPFEIVCSALYYIPGFSSVYRYL
jgi:hypothetical protein